MMMELSTMNGDASSYRNAVRVCDIIDQQHHHDCPTLPDSQTMSAIQQSKFTKKITKWLPFNHCQLIKSDPRPSDIVQGSLGNCWFLAALSLIVRHSHLLNNILLTSQTQFDNDKRAKVRLFLHGKWHYITVDQWLPCDDQGNLVFAEIKRNQLFVALIEKAMAKLLGGYERLIGGLSSEALTSLTGFPCQVLNLPNGTFPKQSQQEEQDPLELWHKILNYNSSQFLMIANCGRNELLNNENLYKNVGLLVNHAYSILDVISIDGLKLVKLRNPWGTVVWNGDWSEESSLWNEKLKTTLNASNLSSDGIFWISYNDLCVYFDHVIVCKVRHEWVQYSYIEQLVLSFNEKDDHATIFQLEPIENECTEVMCTLYKQPTKTCSTTMIVLYELMPSKTSYVLGKLICVSVSNNQKSITCEAQLKLGVRYLLAAFTLNNDHCNNFILRIYSSKPLNIKPFTPNPALRGDLIIHYALAYGKPFKKGKMIAYHLNDNWPGLISVIENHHQTKWLQVSMQCRSLSCNRHIGQSSCLITSRQSMLTEDLIPPRHCQVINVLITNRMDCQPANHHINISMNYKYLLIEQNDSLNGKHSCIWHEPDINKTYGMHSSRPLINYHH